MDDTTIAENLKQGYNLAKTPKQLAKVKGYHAEIQQRVKRMNKLLNEILKTKTPQA